MSGLMDARTSRVTLNMRLSSGEWKYVVNEVVGNAIDAPRDADRTDQNRG
jgi:hypothetical protein